MKTDIEIAQAAQAEKMRPILDLAREKLGIPSEMLEPYGHYKAKISLEYLESLKNRKNGKLILVSAITPTPAGEGKTTTTVGLGDALNLIGRKAMICLREPALGPCFGIKGGAAGGGYSQVIPMEDINLHFTGDFHAIGAAHNLLAAMIDNHLYHHSASEHALDSRRIRWRRVMDMNDRALRQMVVGLGGPANGYSREDGFDIVAASEVMAVLCLSRSIDDLKERLGNIWVGDARRKESQKDGQNDALPIHARDLKASGAMAALLKDALKPNLVQTLENNPALIHGGPFANIAHGCNSVIATQAALKMADYVVTEAGFGADLGLEKFIDIKCRKAGLKPDGVVLVATVRAIKYQGGVALKELSSENLAALERGFVNVERHLHNVRSEFGLPCVVAINQVASDTEAELSWLKARVEALGSRVVLCNHWAKGGKGAEELAREVVAMAEEGSPGFRFLYPDELPLWEKIRTVAQRLYGAADISAEAKVRDELAEYSKKYGHLPVCIAKTQYSFSSEPTAKGAPSGHILPIREVRPALGAGFIVAICGSMMTMPGLPKQPAAERIDVDLAGRISGLF
jgi:formate--tetrahydrofolate ligase